MIGELFRMVFLAAARNPRVLREIAIAAGTAATKTAAVKGVEKIMNDKKKSQK